MSYGDKEFQKHLYNLHSICIHDGNATTGHYYSYIYDSFNKKWIKYSDIKIQEVSEEEVFKVAEGSDSSW